MHEMYIIQGIIYGLFICIEYSVANEAQAYKEADKLLNSPTFNGDSVRIITRDSELLWCKQREITA